MSHPDSITPRHVYAARAMLKHIETLRRHMDGVRADDDIEHVHQTRVASRRLRTTLELFNDVLPAKRSARWLKRIKKTARTLGTARDLDVQICFVEQFIQTLPDNAPSAKARPGLNRLLLRLKQARADCQHEMVGAVDKLESSNVVNQIDQWLHKIRAGGQQVRSGNAALRREAGQLITERMQDVLAYEPFVHMPRQTERLHAMRIAMKKLRYAMEVFAPASKPIKKRIDRIKQYQQLLGDLHDCDVWLARLPLFINQEKARFERFFGHTRGFGRLMPGLDMLQQHQADRREAVYRRFTELWQEDQDKGFWAEFRQALVPASSPRPRQTSPLPQPPDDPDADAQPPANPTPPRVRIVGSLGRINCS
jgi:CHAD domain-containing protein